jgi:two-component system, cell cycle sensor histidine kinase and response regulator CckA
VTEIMSGKPPLLNPETLAAALNALLAEYPTAFVAAINADGVFVPMPASVPLRGQQVLKARSGIDLVVPEDHQLVIATWERARETGASSAQVRLKLDPGRPAVIHYVDARARHGVYVGVVVGSDAAALTSLPEIGPPPQRMARVRKNEVAIFIEVDEAITRILGWTAADMVGLRSLDFIHPEDQERAMESWMQMLSEPGAAQPPVRLRHRRSDESWAWFEVTNHNQLADPDRGYVLAEMIDISDEMAAQEALRASEMKYRTLFEESFDGLFITSPAGRILDMNRKGVAMFGYDTKEEVLRLDLERDVYARPLDRARILAMVQASGSAECEVDVKKKNGELMSTHYALTAVPDEHGVISSYRGIIRDITERKREEEALHRLNRELRASRDCNQTMMRAEDEQTLLNDVCRIVCDEAGYRMAWVGYAENDDAKTVRPVAWAGVEDGYLAVTRVTWADTERGRGATGTAIRGGESSSQDFVTDPQAAPWREDALQRGYRTGIALPLKDETANVFGALSIYSTEPDAFTLDERRLLEQLASDLAFGIMVLRTELTFRAVLEQSPNAIVAIDDGGLLVYANPSAAQTFGYSTAELNGMSVDLLVPDGFHGNHEQLRAAYVAGPRSRPLGTGVDLLGRRRDGSAFPVEISLTPVDTPAGHRVFATIVDTSERTRLELKLRQALKLESIGRLAGGIAHDFNNLLTAIRGYAELARGAIPQGDPAADDVDQVLLAADRAAALTHQLLAFSRLQVLQPQVLDVGEAVERLRPMLQRLLGEHIVLEADGMRGLGHVRVDPGQLEQIIVNLVVNARDAMPRGGQLAMEAADVELGPEYAAAHPEVMPGRYVLLAVSDTGSGMDAETQARAFEPFYTTKEPGRGTGMGLATVYGIVKQSGGYIYVSSEPGRGTTLRIYFPRVDEPLTADDRPSELPTHSGTETILLAEDDPAVRDFARRALSAHGYTVVEAASGAQALALAAQPGARMDLLMTDVAMPSMNGPELAAQIRSERPGLPVLYVSGFAENHFGRSDLPAEGVAFLPKPFSADTVARVVRELLDASR